jgi:hypothetical protein
MAKIRQIWSDCPRVRQLLKLVKHCRSHAGRQEEKTGQEQTGAKNPIKNAHEKFRKYNTRKNPTKGLFTRTMKTLFARCRSTPLTKLEAILSVVACRRRHKATRSDS